MQTTPGCHGVHSQARALLGPNSTYPWPVLGQVTNPLALVSSSVLGDAYSTQLNGLLMRIRGSEDEKHSAS